MNSEITTIRNTRELILLGDLNAGVGKKQDDKVVGSYGENITNNNKSGLVTICKQNQLCVLLTFYTFFIIFVYKTNSTYFPSKSIKFKIAAEPYSSQ